MPIASAVALGKADQQRSAGQLSSGRGLQGGTHRGEGCLLSPLILHEANDGNRRLERVSILANLLAIAAGIGNPFQAGANAQLYKNLHGSLWTAIWVYVSGLCGILLVQTVMHAPLPGSGDVRQVPWWAWTGGVVSIVSTIVGLVFAQKLGAGVFTGLSVTASIVCSISLDHFGLIGFKVHPASPMRLIGGALMIVGLWLVSKG